MADRKSNRKVGDTQFGHLLPRFPDAYRVAVLAERHVFSDPDSSVAMTRRAQELVIKGAHSAIVKARHPTGSTHDRLRELLKEANEPDSILKQAGRARNRGNTVMHSGTQMTCATALEANGWLWEVTARLMALIEDRPLDPATTFDPAEGKRIASQKNYPKLARDLTVELKKTASERDDAQDQAGMLATMMVAAARGLPGIEAAMNSPEVTAEDVVAMIADATGFGDRANSLDRLRDAVILERLEAWSNGTDVPAVASFVDHDGGPATIDHVLWSDAGLPLAILETTFSRSSLQAGMAHAEAVADRIETEHGTQPVIFASNGFDNIRRDPGFAPDYVDDFDTFEALNAR